MQPYLLIYRKSPKIKVTSTAVANARTKIDEAMRYRPQQESIACRIQRGSAVARGWSNYFCIAHNFSKVANKLDHYAFWSATKAISRKLDISTAKVFRRYCRQNVIQVDEACKLAKFSATRMKLYYRNPADYEPVKAEYLEYHDYEVATQFIEGRRKGQFDLKWQALQRDDYKCQSCGRTVTAKTSNADHIKPVRNFASFEQSNHIGNVQTLCINCHKSKTYSK
ncbi:MAG: HNH endonuclease [Sedimentisphaerales bacterium]